MANKNGLKPGSPSNDPKNVIVDFFWQKWRKSTIAFFMVASIVVALSTTENLWRPILAAWQSPLEVVQVLPVAGMPRTFDVVVRNSLSQPAVISGVQIEVVGAEASSETIAGSSSLPVTEHFDAVLRPKPGSVATLLRDPFQVPANSVERFRMRLGTEPHNLSERIDYVLILSFQTNGADAVRSEPFEARLRVR